MLPSPFRFEKTDLTAQDYETLGKLSLRWSHIDHVIANCLKRLLRLSDDEARLVVFPLNTDTRLKRMRALVNLKPLPTNAAKQAFDELCLMMKGLQAVRNNVAHAVIMPAVDTADPFFELRSHDRRFTKAQVFETEEITNYAAHAALVLRDELGDKDPAGAPSPLPARPRIPAFLKKSILGRD
jgi:hypothetical protein